MKRILLVGSSQIVHIAEYDVYTIDRYGNWSYCSIEDCIQQSYKLVMTFDVESK